MTLRGIGFEGCRFAMHFGLEDYGDPEALNSQPLTLGIGVHGRGCCGWDVSTTKGTQNHVVGPVRFYGIFDAIADRRPVFGCRAQLEGALKLLFGV